MTEIDNKSTNPWTLINQELHAIEIAWGNPAPLGAPYVMSRVLGLLISKMQPHAGRGDPYYTGYIHALSDALYILIRSVEMTEGHGEAKHE